MRLYEYLSTIYIRYKFIIYLINNSASLVFVFTCIQCSNSQLLEFPPPQQPTILISYIIPKFKGVNYKDFTETSIVTD